MLDGAEVAHADGAQSGAFTASIRLVIIARRQLDSDALAALFRAHSGFRVLCSTNDRRMAAYVCRHRRPNVALLDAFIIGSEGWETIASIQQDIGGVSILILDDGVKEARLAMALEHPNVGYFTRDTTFSEIAVGLCRLSQGEQAYGPMIENRLQRTRTGWRLRRDASNSTFASLTQREIEVLRLIALGNTIKECAKHLRLSPSTVDNHKSRLMKKLGVHRSLDLTRLALQEGLIQL